MPSAPISIFLVSDLSTNNPTMRLDAHYFDPRYFATMDTLEAVAKAKGWEIELLGKLLREGRGNMAGGATPRGASYPDEGPKFIRVQNVRPYRLEWDSKMTPVSIRGLTRASKAVAA